MASPKIEAELLQSFDDADDRTPLCLGLRFAVPMSLISSHHSRLQSLSTQARSDYSI